MSISVNNNRASEEQAKNLVDLQLSVQKAELASSAEHREQTVKVGSP